MLGEFPNSRIRLPFRRQRPEPPARPRPTDFEATAPAVEHPPDLSLLPDWNAPPQQEERPTPQLLQDQTQLFPWLLIGSVVLALLCLLIIAQIILLIVAPYAVPFGYSLFAVQAADYAPWDSEDDPQLPALIDPGPVEASAPFVNPETIYVDVENVPDFGGTTRRSLFVPHIQFGGPPQRVAIVATGTPTRTPRPTRTPQSTEEPTRTPQPTDVPTRTPRPTREPTRTSRPTRTPLPPTTAPTRTPPPDNTPTRMPPVIQVTATSVPVQNTPRNTRTPGPPPPTARPTNTPRAMPVATYTPTTDAGPPPAPSNTPTPQPTIVEFVAASMHVTEHEGTARVRVRLNVVSSEPVQVRYLTSAKSAIADEDYSSSTGLVTFEPGDVLQEIRIPLLDDTIDEPNERFTIYLSNPQNALLGIPDTIAVTINDDDSSGMTIFPAQVFASENGATGSYQIVLESKPTANVQIIFSSDSQIAPIPAMVITPDEWDRVHTVNVAASDDAIAENNPHPASIRHTVLSTDNRYNHISTADIAVEIEDNDHAAVLLAESNGSTVVSEDGDTDTYTIVLTSQPIAPVFLSIRPADNNIDLGAGAGANISMSFTASNWDIPQTVDVAAVDDMVVEGPHTSSIGHFATGDDPFYSGIPVGDVAVDILDNDSTIGDLVWEDMNADGIQDAGELGIEGVTVLLLDENGNMLGTTSTDEDGLYSFSGMGPGTYRIEVEAPSAFHFSPANEGTDDSLDSDATVGMFPFIAQTEEIVIGTGFNSQDTHDIGMYRLAHIGNYVWNDSYGNGIQEASESGLGGVTLTLYKSTAPLTPIASVTSSATGAYNFANLRPGTYQIAIEAPAGYHFSPPLQGGDPTRDSDATDITSGRTSPIVVVSGQTDTSIDFGLAQPATIGDLVWYDTNADGVQDADEPGLGDVSVKLFRTDGTLEASTQTDDAGHYSFIAPGNDYYIEVDLPTGYDFSPPYSAGAAIDSDITSTTATGGRTDTFTVTGGNTDTTRDIGLWSQIGDRVWEDLNANGVQDAGEPGIDGVSVRLLDSGGNPLTPPRTTTTAGGGYYGFSNLPNGSYIVEFAPPDSSYRFTAGDVGSDTFDSDVVTIPTIPGPGRTQPINIAGAIPPGHRADAGLYRLASIGDRVWIDIGGNARQQGNEPGVPGVIVRLFDSTDTEIISTTTDADGYYAFTEVEPASGYYLVFDMPTTDHRLVQPDQGTDNTRDSDAHPVTFRAPTTGGISLVSGQQDNSWDAGMPLAIGDFVWEDSNADGIQTPGELGLDGVTVNLYDSSYTLVATTTTAHGGRYGFTGLPDGWYRLEFVLPTNYSFTAPHLGTIWDDSDVDTNITPTSGFTDWITHTTTAFPNSWSDAGMLTTALDGRIWHDQDADGIYDMGQDGGIDGITVQLLNGSGALLATTTTAGYGYYRFEGLSPGTYQIAPVLPPGASYMVSPRDQGSDDEHDSEADPATGRIGPITLDANHVLYNLDAALYRAPSIGDRAWHDLDHDGVQDSDEPGFANLPVRLYREGELTPLASTTTATDGSYEFVGLQPGRYLVEFSLPPEYFFTIRDAPEADDATDSDADPATGRTEAIDVVSKPHTFDMHYDDLDAGLVN